MVIGAEAMDAPLHIPWASGGGLLTGHFPLQALAPLLSAVGYAPGAHVPRCVAGLSSTPRATLTQWGESPDSSPSLPPFVGGSGHEATWSLRGPHEGLTAEHSQNHTLNWLFSFHPPQFPTVLPGVAS